MRTRIVLPVVAAAVGACLLAPPAEAQQRHPGVRLLGERIVPHALSYRGTTVGGLSGIDRDPRTGGYVLISDDRSALQPARFYTAAIPVDATGVGPVTFTATHPLRRPDGQVYPPLAAGDGTTVDPEDIRVDPWTGRYTWSQEGERQLTPGAPPVLIQPSIRDTARDGAFVRELPLPADERITAGSTGPQQNLVLEGLTYALGGALITSDVEGPLLQDAPNATTEHGTLSRITVQTRTGAVLAQYAYPQDELFAAPVPPTGFATTGVPAILAVDRFDPTRYLVLERSFVTGVGNRIRIYEIDTTGASNVRDLPSLAGRRLTPVRKHLLVDLADLDLSTVDNVEGMTWGPVLPSGERTLVLVSDDNFAATQVTQVIALAVRG